MARLSKKELVNLASIVDMCARENAAETLQHHSMRPIDMHPDYVPMVLATIRSICDSLNSEREYSSCYSRMLTGDEAAKVYRIAIDGY